MAQRTKVTDTNATDTPLQAHLASLDACPEARAWAGTKTTREAWETCERADWLLWWAARTNVNTPLDIVRCVVKIARTVAYLNTDPRVMAAIEAAEAWADNPNSETAAAAAEAAEAAWAAWAAAWAAEAAEAAAWAAWAAWAAGPSINYYDLVRALLKQPWNET